MYPQEEQEPPEPDPRDDPALWPQEWDEEEENGIPVELADLTWAELQDLLARAEQISQADMRAELLLGAAAAGAATAGRRGPGYSGPLAPGVYRGRTAGFARGGALDTAPPSGGLMLLAEDAAGEDGTYPGASADEVLGVVCALDRLGAYVAAQKYRAVAAFIRHRPAEGAGPRVPGGLPRVWDPHTGQELAHCLADGLRSAEAMVEISYDLAAKLPGTMAALLGGAVREGKARIIVRACANLNPAESRAAEDLVLDRAGRLTPGGLREAIARAVMQVNPDAARQRREDAAKTRRVEVRPEESGNGQIAIRELGAADVAAIDQELSARARELKRAGIGADADDRRVLAFLEKFGLAPGLPGTGGTGNGGPAIRGSVNLTIPAVTTLGLGDRPGEVAGLGPVDPALARDLATAILNGPAGNKICLTVTDQAGMMTGHGCARPATRADRERWGLDTRPGPGLLTLTRLGTGADPLGCQPWLLDPGSARTPQIIRIWPVTTDPCDHRLRAAGHDPGTELRHLVGLRYGHCTGPVCRRPAHQSDYEHDEAWASYKMTCLCQNDPKCRRCHQVKQAKGWSTAHDPDGSVTWTSPTGRQATTEPYRFPV